MMNVLDLVNLVAVDEKPWQRYRERLLIHPCTERFLQDCPECVVVWLGADTGNDSLIMQAPHKPNFMLIVSLLDTLLATVGLLHLAAMGARVVPRKLVCIGNLR